MPWLDTGVTDENRRRNIPFKLWSRTFLFSYHVSSFLLAANITVSSFFLTLPCSIRSSAQTSSQKMSSHLSHEKFEVRCGQHSFNKFLASEICLGSQSMMIWARNFASLATTSFELCLYFEEWNLTLNFWRKKWNKSLRLYCRQMKVRRNSVQSYSFFEWRRQGLLETFAHELEKLCSFHLLILKFQEITKHASTADMEKLYNVSRPGSKRARPNLEFWTASRRIPVSRCLRFISELKLHGTG